ncbi:MAG: glucose-6-phosphate isomerase [Alphaproteobacteria bacterium]|jgi:glucose-6-phosphate isomerase|nr:glucose-6-phosphate isomerase [Rhodospirillaceae bacterium]MBT6203449.1 glucose-6-phosphate isomerase [Rhodospirillaceae bacterium]MBT7647788.1 glucose-6-phosphate isomerase [Rhodospirillaceae bacterium]MDG2480575.1 glucose-6-phosphate isomerase [Alphaproteobacteria bacterium]
MTYRLSISPTGSDDPDLDRSLVAAVERVRVDLAAGDLACLTVAGDGAELVVLQDEAERIAAGADDVLVLGIGGSSLAAQTLVALAPGQRGPVRQHLFDNIDPQTWADMLGGLQPERTHVLAVSKSGGTAETLCQTLLAVDWLTAAGCTLSEHLTVISEPGPRPLRDFAEAAGARVLDHAPDIGGRFSALSLAGLLPALLAGLDASAVRQGAVAVIDGLLRDGLQSPVALGARSLVGHERRGIAVQVVMPYADRLGALARWWSQIWGESLGKDGKGSTPFAATGVTDQHSQLQLWCDGPKRHMVTVLGVAPDGVGPVMTTDHDALGYLDGRTMGDLLGAEREATCESLIAAGVPVRRFMVDRVDERALGALFAHFMLETILVAHMMGVDPFGQPAVEVGKQRARDKLKAMG